VKFSKFVLTGLLLWGFMLYGADYRGGESIYINTGDSVTTDLFVSARYVELNAPVADDIYAACQEIVVNDEVGDDLLAFCQAVTVKGHVQDMVLGFAQKITIDNTVEGDVLAFGSEVHLTPNAHIKGSLLVGCGTLTIDGGKIEGGISGGSGQAYLNGAVNGKVSLNAGNIRFGDNYNAAGGTSITLHEPLKEEIKNSPADLEISVEPQKHFFQSGFFFWAFAAALVTGLFMITFFKDFSREISLFARTYALKNSGIGSLLLFMIPVIIIILLVLIITIPISLMFTAVYLFLLYISTIVSGLALGCYIMDKFRKNGRPSKLFLSLFIGLIIIFLIVETPYIGWIFSFAALVLGMGSFVMYFYNKLPGKEQNA